MWGRWILPPWHVVRAKSDLGGWMHSADPAMSFTTVDWVARGEIELALLCTSCILD